MALSVQGLINRHNDLRRKKTTWNNHWQMVAEYVLTRKSDFTVKFQPGEFLNKELFDSTAPKVNEIMASSLLGMLWPNGGNSFRFKRPINIRDIKEHKDYYDWAHEQLANAMDSPKAGLNTALEEYMRDQGAFGTAGLAIFEGDETDLLYRPWDVKHMTILEGVNGFVNTIFYEVEKTVTQVINEYGEDAVSEETLKKWKENRGDEKIKVLHVIEPREDRDMAKEGNKAMPFKSLHIEVDGKKLLRESGFEEMPVKVSRFRKVIGEVYGRSPAMEALPDILEINAIREAEILAIEKLLDPPLGVLDDGKLGSTVVDTSPGAVNVFNIAGRLGSNQQPIFPLFTIGDIKSTLERIEELKASISDHFFIDRLLDLNNETQMTLGEAQLRNKLRGFTLGTLFARQVTELFTPLIERSFNIMFRKGKLGVIEGSQEEKLMLEEGKEPRYIPGEIAQAILRGEDVYNIEYMTPAQRTVQAEDVQGVFQTWQFANEMAAARPEVYDNLDEDESIRIVALGTGSPNTVLRSKGELKKIRDVRAEVQEQQRQMEQMKEGAQVVSEASKIANQS